MVRNIDTETIKTFIQLGTSNFTFKDLIRPKIEWALRIFTQHFQHGKAVQYTKPHCKIAKMFTKAVTSRQALSLTYIELILTKLKAYATKLRQLIAIT